MMAVPFINRYVVLSAERAEHINLRHVNNNNIGVSKFKLCFNLSSTLALLTKKTFDDGKFEIVDSGWKHGQYYYMYIFDMPKVIGFDPWGVPVKLMCVYYTWKAEYGDQFHITTAYPFSRRHHEYLKWLKLGVEVGKTNGSFRSHQML